MVSSVTDIQENAEMLKHLSHLANCQYKWLERIIEVPEAAGLGWWEPVHKPDNLIAKFEEGTQLWVEYLNAIDEDEVENRIQYNRGAAGIAEVKIKDIALQLIFHSFHHRAQIQLMIREKGGTPGFIDYLGARVTKKEGN
jgi:uncharacterized damage-inducible protein DinB